MSQVVTVHMVGNAHLDPVFLWPWQRGADEALATCRTACDMLDDNGDAVFIRGEAWVYEQIRLLEPALLERIRGHLQAGRWAVVNGWWVQPDTNLPAEQAILQSARLGQEWFRHHLGLAGVPVAYNIDSFGHGAFLPRMIRQAGQRYYVFTRPEPGHMDLPAGPFRWQSPDGHEVLALRMPTYGWDAPDLSGDLRMALDNRGQVNHAVCFYGVCDHGGGPTRAAIEWIRSHQDFAPGVRLEFSSPERFFRAVEPSRASLPAVVGELQYSQVGCYSVCGDLKRDMRRAEHLAIDTQALLKASAPELAGSGEAAAELEGAWKIVCFNGFHDILAGSSLAEGIAAQERHLGEAICRLERLEHRCLRTHPQLAAKAHIEGHRIHVVNRLDVPWSGGVEGEFWFDYMPWAHHLEDEAGAIVPHQMIEPSSAILDSLYGGHCIRRILVPAALGPRQWQTLRIVHGESKSAGGGPTFADGSLSNGLTSVSFGEPGVAAISQPGQPPLLAAPLRLLCINDPSDTWSSRIDRFAGPVRAEGQFSPPVLVEQGALRATVRLDGRIGASPAKLFVALCAGSPAVHVRLDVLYQERISVLKADVAVAGGVSIRQDRVAGGWVDRPANGRECVAHHATLLGAGDGRSLGLAFPDSFALDCDTARGRLTLLRNSLHVLLDGRWDRSTRPRLCERIGTDEGNRSLRLVLLPREADRGAMEDLLNTLQRPPHFWDDYRGVSRVHRYEKHFGPTM